MYSMSFKSFPYIRCPCSILSDFGGKKNLCQRGKNELSNCPAYHREIITSDSSITVREEQERGAEDGSTGLKELADEVNGEGGYVLDENVSSQSQLFSDSSRVVCFFKASWTRYSTYTGRGGYHRQ